jgi:hypothetical protein
MITLLNNLILVIVITFAAKSFATETPKYLLIRKGQVAYTDTDGGTATTQTICKTAKDMNKWLNLQKGNCFTVLPGVPVTFTSSIAKEVSGIAPTYIVEVKAKDGSWRGFAYTMFLQPVIPRGERLKLSSDIDNKIVHAQNLSGKAINLVSGTTIEVLEQHPDRQEKDLKAKVTSGKYDGETVWTSSFYVVLNSGGLLYWSTSAD